tara:strand:+ start:873 stop:980 length:108 start_codon:yes stop_codon:yes gene_type:complete
MNDIIEFSKHHPFFAVAFFLCGWYLGATIKYLFTL